MSALSDIQFACESRRSVIEAGSKTEGDKMKSNAETARDLVNTWDGSLDTVLAHELRLHIESALTTAQSELARQVIAELVEVSRTRHFDDYSINDGIEKVRDLFTRLGVEIGESE